jgi:hypothetical protein
LGVAALLFSQNSGDDDVILKAMRDEMERSKQLKIVGGGDPPYFISYGVTEADTFRTAAQLGSVVIGSRNRFRSPTTEVRVGSYEFDHTGHIFSGAFTGTRFDSDSWPLDNLYGPIREAIWLSHRPRLQGGPWNRSAANAGAEQRGSLYRQAGRLLARAARQKRPENQP